MNRRICRQVLDCGDGVREVTALAVAALKIPKRAADTATPTQSGDSEDSVAAVQDARAPTRFALGSWPRCAAKVDGSFTPFCVAMRRRLTACGKTDLAPSPELATNGTVEVTARLIRIGGSFRPTNSTITCS